MGDGCGMRIGLRFGVAAGLSALAFVAPASAKECVEPYGELVAVSDVETIVRIKPECMEIAAKAGGKTTEEVSLVSALLVEPATTPRQSVRPRLPDPVELAARPRAKRIVSCSDPAVCGTPRVAKAERPSRCEYGRAYAVGISPGLTEVRVYEDCRYLMNPQVATAAAVPAVLAPDWELDTSPPPAPPKRRRRVQPACDEAGTCSDKPAVKAVPAPTGTAQSAAVQPREQGRTIETYRLAGAEYVALINRRYVPGPVRPVRSIA